MRVLVIAVLLSFGLNAPVQASQLSANQNEVDGLRKLSERALDLVWQTGSNPGLSLELQYVYFSSVRIELANELFHFRNNLSPQIENSMQTIDDSIAQLDFRLGTPEILAGVPRNPPQIYRHYLNVVAARKFIKRECFNHSLGDLIAKSGVYMVTRENIPVIHLLLAECALDREDYSHALTYLDFAENTLFNLNLVEIEHRGVLESINEWRGKASKFILLSEQPDEAYSDRDFALHLNEDRFVTPEKDKHGTQLDVSQEVNLSMNPNGQRMLSPRNLSTIFSAQDVRATALPNNVAETPAVSLEVESKSNITREGKAEKIQSPHLSTGERTPRRARKDKSTRHSIATASSKFNERKKETRTVTTTTTTTTTTVETWRKPVTLAPPSYSSVIGTKKPLVLPPAPVEAELARPAPRRTEPMNPVKEVNSLLKAEKRARKSDVRFREVKLTQAINLAVENGLLKHEISGYLALGKMNWDNRRYGPANESFVTAFKKAEMVGQSESGPNSRQFLQSRALEGLGMCALDRRLALDFYYEALRMASDEEMNSDWRKKVQGFIDNIKDANPRLQNHWPRTDTIAKYL